jgi:hypothetical protein
VWVDDLSTWPTAKLTHARSRARELETLAGRWRDSWPITAVPTLSSDGLRIDWLLRMDDKPSLDEVSLLLGDVLHALRSGLDACAFDLAYVLGVGPKRPGQIYFPLESSRKDWIRRSGALETWPPEALERVHALQPYHLTDPSTSALAWLKALSDLEKHRSAVEISTPNIDVRSSFLLHVHEPETEVQMHVPDQVDLANGELVAWWEASKPVSLLSEGEARVEVDLIVRLGQDGAPLTLFLEAVVLATGRVLECLSGQRPAEEAQVIFGTGSNGS